MQIYKHQLFIENMSLIKGGCKGSL